MEEKLSVQNSLGAIRIADEVVEIIAGIAASKVEGVASMSSGFVGDIASMLTRSKNMAKGVKVEVGEHEAAVDINITVEYGASIPDVALRVQQAVKEGIESMTGLKVIETNIHVQGVQFSAPAEVKPKEDENRIK
ncbi:Asp23/Gls24 family envelope stress response protein [Desulfitobacterium sp.]|uniref:Asp23/Gls24 family envelope stress response protein n=1 Tax=Desulfitobacterium sp. TaxID=49981 RepID=UPI002B1F034F|nr:Asp23/Gls24 family envelope stress response protein [Desulfitobacterium sp.]MEA4903089.1 Asp23/Gls24 family envelope stress response protein [Desulfitobacterium sp.]